MRIVISLTTIPSRVLHLKGFLSLLQQQTFQPDRIYINLPKWSKRENCAYPEPDIEETDQVRIIRCEDYGPITKLYPILSEELDPETIIITLDDDIEYIPDRIQQLVQMTREYPNAAIGGSGFILGELWNFFGTVRTPKTATLVDVLEGYSGCAYRRKFFQDDLLNYDQAPKEAFYHDDVWISGHLARQNIPRIVHEKQIDSSFGNSGYGQEKHLSNGLSGDILGFIQKILPVFLYFRSQGLFHEKQVVSPIRTFGFWILIIILVIIAFFLLI